MRYRSKLLIAAALCLLTSPTSAPRAAVDVVTPLTNADGFELIVMEAPGCGYCGLFRRDVLPSFQTSERAKTLPVRFLDVNNVEAEQLELTSPVQIVPTFVLVRAKKEIGRIPGYTGPELFFRSIGYLLKTAP